MDEFLSAEQLAKRWRLRPQTIYNQVSRGDPLPPSMKIGKRGARRWRLKDVEAFEEEHILPTSIHKG